MQQQRLFKISLIVSMIGILILLFLSNFLEPKSISISEIDDSMINKKVKVQGEILKITDKKSFLIISLEDKTGKIDVLCECKNNFQNNQKISVYGTIKEYQKSLQIQADKIIKIES